MFTFPCESHRDDANEKVFSTVEGHYVCTKNASNVLFQSSVALIVIGENHGGTEGQISSTSSYRGAEQLSMVT